jgi:oxygen-dependent protoporphyrinogen oxidase
MGLRLVIVGGGISGLSLAHALAEQGRFEITVLEAAKRPGGKIWSDMSDGFLCESGVNGFLDNKPATLELSSRLSLSPIRSSDAARKRFLYSGSVLHRLPESPPAFIKSALISLPGKLRLALEPFVAKGAKHDESLADFARRRLGKEAYEKLVDPMASGIYAGDPETLSLKSCFPRIDEIEQKYGSLIKGMISISRERKKSVGAGPGGTLTSFKSGMQTIIDALVDSLGESLRIGRPVLSLEKRGSGYNAYTSDGSKVEADLAVIATPAHQTARILRDFDSTISGPLGEIPYPSLSVVCTGFLKDRLTSPLDSFGFLVPSREKRNILGTLFDSSIFPNRAPEGHVLLRTMVGGARNPHLADLDDSKLLGTVLSELKVIAGIHAEPDFVKIYRHEKAIPQYALGHRDRLKKLEQMLTKHKGLYITGNAYRGVSVNDCIDNSARLAKRISEEVA